MEGVRTHRRGLTSEGVGGNIFRVVPCCENTYGTGQLTYRFLVYRQSKNAFVLLLKQNVRNVKILAVLARWKGAFEIKVQTTRKK